MQLVKIDGMEVIINMDKVVTLKVRKCDNDYWDFYVNDKIQGRVESTYEKDRVMQMLFETFGMPGAKLHIDERGYEIKSDELWK